MIQRKQTLFLLFAVIAIAICLFLPIASIAAMVYNLGVVGEAGMQISTTCVPLFLLLAVSAIIALVNIFLYKNLKLQKSLCTLAMLFAGLWYVDYIVMFMGLIPVPEAEGTMKFQFAACLPLVAIIFEWMAMKGVNDDIKLLRAADRIR
jgi:hypothetical protein